MDALRSAVDRLFPGDRKLRVAVAWYQIVGGLIGLLVLLPGVFLSGNLKAHALSGVIGTLYFAFLALAGYLLFREHPLGPRLSLIAQYLQVPQVVTNAVSFYAYAPVKLVLLLESGGAFGLGIEFGSDFTLAVGDISLTSSIGINVIPFAVVLMIRERILGEVLPSQLARRRGPSNRR